MTKYNTLKEREILKFRYGWDADPMTMNEVGGLFGITPERVRQLQSMALRKLRQRWGRVMAKEYYNERIVNIGRDCTFKSDKKIDFIEKYFKEMAL